MPIEEFEQLYFNHFNVLCKITYRFTRNREFSEDIVQDVFVRYWNRYGKSLQPESPIAYLRKSCINQALNFLKEKERRSEREQLFAAANSKQDASAHRPDTRFQQEEAADRLQWAISQLPDACRNAFLLSRFEQKNYREIAGLMQISVSTVEKHIGKALKRLRKVLSEPRS